MSVTGYTLKAGGKQDLAFTGLEDCRSAFTFERHGERLRQPSCLSLVKRALMHLSDAAAT